MKHKNEADDAPQIPDKINRFQSNGTLQLLHASDPTRSNIIRHLLPAGANDRQEASRSGRYHFPAGTSGIPTTSQVGRCPLLREDAADPVDGAECGRVERLCRRSQELARGYGRVQRDGRMGSMRTRVL